MGTFSKIVSKMSESETIKISDLALSLKQQGKDILALSAGEPDFDTPRIVKESAIKAINNGKTKYTDVSGIPELKAAIINKFKLENDLSYSRDEIIVSSGGKQVLFNALASILNPGDEVLVLKPYWVSYPEMIKLFGAKPVFIDTDPNNFGLPSAKQLNRAMTTKTKCIIINSPNNPSGAIFNSHELRELNSFLQDNKKIWVISDEIYEHIIFDDQKHLSILNIAPKLKDRTVIINGVSKSHAMTGWRIGFGAASAQLINKMKKVQSQTTSSASSISQWAAVTALSECQKIIKHNKRLFQLRRDLILKNLSKNIPLSIVIPKGSFYLMLNISQFIGLKYKISETISSDTSFSELLLKHKMVALVPGSSFGMPNFVRISFATSEGNIIKACSRIHSFLKELN